MISVAAQLNFPNESSRDYAVKRSIRVQLATRENEAGCHACCFSTDPCDALSIPVYEPCSDSETLVSHFYHVNYQDMLLVSSEAGVLEGRNRA